MKKEFFVWDTNDVVAVADRNGYELTDEQIDNICDAAECELNEDEYVCGSIRDIILDCIEEELFREMEG